MEQIIGTNFEAKFNGNVVENSTLKLPSNSKKRKPAKKVFCPKVGGYFYAIHNSQIKECRIAAIIPTHRPFDANWVKFRDTKTKKLHEAYLKVSTMAMTKKQAKTQLVKLLRKEFKAHMKAFKDANGELNFARNELNKALRIKV